MYLLDELVKEHQKTLLEEARMVHQAESVAGNEIDQPKWRVTVGDFLIDSGLRLKGQKGRKKQIEIPYHTSLIP